MGAEKILLKNLGVTAYGSYKISSEGSSSSRIQIRNSKEIRRVGNYLYKGEFFGLTRKYEKWKQIEENIKDLNITSKYIGVSINKRCLDLGYKNIWKAHFKRKHLGYFASEELANEARLKYIKELESHPLL